MDIDPNDLLFTNEYIKELSLQDTDPAIGEEFRKYYEDQMQKEEEIRVIEDLKNFTINEEFDDNNLINTNGVTSGNLLGVVDPKVYKREIKTLVSIDSRDRNTLLYESPNYFKIFLGKTFTNVKSVKLVSIEFPNTDAVINSGNNVIAWRNEEDIINDTVDNITGTYPIYSVNLQNGSYNLRTLQTEITNKVSFVKTKTGDDFHYFVVEFSEDTDIASFTSLNLTLVTQNDPVTVIAGSTIVKIDFGNVKHGYNNGDLIYIFGIKSIGGLSYSILNGAYRITGVTDYVFYYEIVEKASTTVQSGGGANVKTGKLAPFQLLFGNTKNTIARNLGFPLEDSSQRLDSKISKIENYYQVLLRFTETHVFTNTFNYLNKECIINATSGLNSGPYTISGVLDSNTILIKVDGKIVVPNSFSMTVLFTDTDNDGNVLEFLYNVEFISNYNIDTILISTFTDHNFTVNDIRKEVIMYNSTSNPVIDGKNTIINVLSSTDLLVAGNLLPLGGVNSNNQNNPVGLLPINNPLETEIKQVTNIEIFSNKTKITCPGHGLSIGDKVRFSKTILSIPHLFDQAGIAVTNVPDSDTFEIDIKLDSVDLSTVNTIDSYIGKNIIKITFSNHNFNNIITITDTTYPSLNQSDVLQDFDAKLVTTQLPHGLKDGDKIRIMQTGITGLEDTGYIVKTTGPNDEFIAYLKGQNVRQGTSSTGILGLNHDFYLYGCKSVGGISENALNSVLHTVKDIIDENNFTFTVENEFATSSEQGGGSNIFVSSLKHGFSGTQDNTRNDILNRSINLEGENYVFLCCPQLSTMINTGIVKDVFARITLDQSPGAVVFSYLSNPKEFTEAPLAQLNELEFTMRNYNNSLYDFFDLDYSFTLEITEIQDTVEYFNQSSRMISNTSINTQNTNDKNEKRETMLNYKLN